MYVSYLISKFSEKKFGNKIIYNFYKEKCKMSWINFR